MGRYRKLVNEIRKKSFPEIKGRIWIIKIPFPIPGGVAIWLFPKISLLGLTTKCNMLDKKVLTGLIAHELAHFSRFGKKGYKEFWRYLFFATKKQGIKEEKETDKLAIRKGYGKELIFTKQEAKKLLADTKWEKYLDDRYMDAKEAKEYMNKIRKKP